ncbi:hypothetical protein ACHAXR_013158 [Thalassiosira sp. AJA248-18]
MEEEKKTATQAPKSADEEAKAEPSSAGDTEEKAASTTAAAAPSKKEDESTKSKDDSADDKKSEETSEPTAAAEDPKDEEEAKEDQKDEDPKEEPKGKPKVKPTEADPMEAETDDDDEEAKPSEPEVLPARRVRKSTQVYEPVEAAKKEKVIPVGKGTKLEDMPNVVANLDKVTWSDPDLKRLYSMVFGMGKKKEFKSHLLQFNGLVYPEGKEEKEQERMKSKMYKLTMVELKAVMDLADIDRSPESFGDKKEAPGKEALCNRFLEWLEEPTASGKKKSKKSPGKRKSTGSAKGSAKKEKAAPAKKAKKEKTPAKKTTAKAKKTSAKKSKAKEEVAEEVAGPVKLDIPGVDIEKVREKVKTIVKNANREELTVKGVRKMLEEWLDTDLTDHKDAVRSIVMEVM